MEEGNELDRLAVQAWVRQELSESLPFGISDDLGWSELYEPVEVVDYATYRKRLPDWAKGYADAWQHELRKLRRRGVSCSALWRLGAKMRQDVDDTVADLTDAPRSVRRAWARWYPTYAASEVARHIERTPWLGMTANERTRTRREAQRRHMEDKRARRQRTSTDALVLRTIRKQRPCPFDARIIARRARPRGQPIEVSVVQESLDRLGALGLITVHRTGSGQRMRETVIVSAANAVEFVTSPHAENLLNH